MTDERALVREANRLNYRLRSTFFYRKLKEYETASFLDRIQTLYPYESLYDWSKRAEWGISEEAFQYAIGIPLPPLQVFCHPKAIREHPRLIAYYRNIAVLSQKSVKYLIGVDVTRYEMTRPTQIIPSDKHAWDLAVLFNEHISLIIESSILTFSQNDIIGLLFSSTGAQIDGSWRNAIGEEAEKVVQRLLVKEAVQRGIVMAFLLREKADLVQFDSSNEEKILSDLHKYRGVILSNQTTILFSSEPDLELLGKDGATVGVIEVKGGADPAGALERYGAAIQSFTKTLNSSPHARTILIANSITPELKRRLNEDKTVNDYFDLASVVGDPAILDKFAQLVFGLLEN